MPSEFGFEPPNPRYALCLVSGWWCALRRFLGLFGAFLGCFSDISWNRRALESSLTRLSEAARAVYSPYPFVWAFRPGFGAVLGEKWLFLAQNCADLGGHLPSWRPRPGPPPVSFWPKTWIWQGHHLGSKMARVE